MHSMFDIIEQKAPKFFSWKQYISKKKQSRRESKQYTSWRLKVLSLYHYQCYDCKSTNNLHVHHIKEYHDNIWLRLRPDNGIVLCRDCHSKRHPHMKQVKPKYILRKKSESLDQRCAVDANVPTDHRTVQTG